MSRRPPNAPLTSAPGKSREAHPLHKRLSSAGPSQHPPVALRPTMAKIDGIRVLRADEVDEDSDLEDKHHTAIYGGQSISRPASGEPKSGTVSRTTSLERGAGSALQHIRLSRRNSEAGADEPGTLSRGQTPTTSQRVSRSNSLAGRHSNRSSAASTPVESALEVGPCGSTVELRTGIRNQRFLDNYHAMEVKMEQRSQHDPSNVQVKRWLLLIAVAMSSKKMLGKGLSKVAVWQKEMWAFNTLTHLFLPVWQLFCYRRRLRAERTIHKFVFKVIRKVRMHRRHDAADMIRHFLRNKMFFMRLSSRYMVSKAVLIQRTFRKFSRRRRAQLELNLLKLRSVERSMYWTRAASIRMDDWKEQARQREQAAALLANQRYGTGRKQAVEPGPKAPEVLSFSDVGQLPDFILKKQLQSRITRASRAWHREVILRRRNATEQVLLARRSSCGSFASYADPSSNARRVVVRMPRYSPFLRESELLDSLDDACLIVGELRGDAAVAAHVKLLQSRSKAMKSHDPNAPLTTFKAFDDAAAASFGSTTSKSFSKLEGSELSRGDAKLSFTASSFKV